MSEFRFDGRVAVITGAGAGLGRAYALLLASRGASVVVNDLGCTTDGQGADHGPAQSVAGEIVAAGGVALANGDSVATAEGGRAVVQAALDHYGRIDILIHSAGILRDRGLHNMDEAAFDAVLAVHAKGAFNVAQPAFVAMRKAGYGRIVLASSVAGLYGNFGQVNYATAKAGLIGMAQTIAIEGAAKGIKANAIVPVASTRMTEGVMPPGTPELRPEMVAHVVGWLCHESCSANGEALIAAGGRVARAFMVESVGVYHDQWSIERVAEEIGTISDTSAPLVLGDAAEHARYNFAMAGLKL